MAEPGEELALGLQLGDVRRAPAAGGEVVVLHLPAALGLRLAEQEAGDGGDAEQAAGQPFAAGRHVAEQRRQVDDPGAEEHQHADHEHPRRLVAMRPVADAHQQGAEVAEDDQPVEQAAGRHAEPVVQRQAEQQQAGGAAAQQAPERQLRRDVAEERRGMREDAAQRRQVRQLGGERLPLLVFAVPGAEQAEAGQAGDQQAEIERGEPDPAARIGIGEAHQLVEQQHHQAAEQHAELQHAQFAARLQAILQADAGIERLRGAQAQIQVELPGGGRQRQEDVAAQQRPGDGSEVAGALLLQQLAVAQDEEFQAVQARREHAQLARPLGGRQVIVQPDRTGAGRGVDVLDIGERAEQRVEAWRGDIVQLQAPFSVMQLRPAGCRTLRSGRHEDHCGKRKADQESNGNPEPVHGEVPSVNNGRSIDKRPIGLTAGRRSVLRRRRRQLSPCSRAMAR
ncbi:hypothetical protein D3C76_825970 [compost metagenome]